jgi:hypothetical protein
MKYITSKSECIKNGLVSSCCGKLLQPIKTVDNSGRPTYWPGCVKHGYFDYGVKRRVFEIAVKMVDERHFWAYHHDKEPDRKSDPNGYNYWRISQIKGTCGVVSDVINYLIN